LNQNPKIGNLKETKKLEQKNDLRIVGVWRKFRINSSVPMLALRQEEV